MERATYRNLSYESEHGTIQPMTHFGMRLRQLREDAGLTQEQLADKVGFDRPNYVRIEGGYRPASDELVEKLASFYGISPKDLKREREGYKIAAKSQLDELFEAMKILLPNKNDREKALKDFLEG